MSEKVKSLTFLERAVLGLIVTFIGVGIPALIGMVLDLQSRVTRIETILEVRNNRVADVGK